MNTLIKRALITGVATASVVTGAQTLVAPAAQAAAYYGAIAVADDGTFGRSWDYPSRGAAEQAARNSCGYTDCQVLASFSNGCGAVAATSRAYAGGAGSSLYTARSRAITRAGGGYILTWQCTSGHA